MSGYTVISDGSFDPQRLTACCSWAVFDGVRLFSDLNTAPLCLERHAAFPAKRFGMNINLAELAAFQAAITWLFVERRLTTSTEVRAFSDSQTLVDLLSGRLEPSDPLLRDGFARFKTFSTLVRERSCFDVTKQAALLHVSGKAIKASVLGH